jgi:protein-S-isoprenylcysteine O-methyltransferase
MLWGIHFALLLVLALSIWKGDVGGSIPTKQLVSSTTNRTVMLLHWSVYVVILCTFHLLEFFATAIYNPTVTTADSFLINHSLMYTAAVLLTWLEFACRWYWWPIITDHNNRHAYYHVFAFGLGILLVVSAQTLRTMAMVTCGESFNHLIQPNKKDNHVLITHGMYVVCTVAGAFYWILI